jgi:outer membrane receptor for ferrienterochelin and colicin
MARLLDTFAFRLLLTTTALMLFPVSAVAQVPTGTISGRVTDTDGGVVQGAAVTLASPNLQGVQVTTTSNNGDYVFRSLPPGPYTVAVQRTGFSATQRTVAVAPSEMVALNLTLQPAGVTEAVTVVADGTNFTNTVQSAANLTYGLIDMLPTARTLLSYINLAPGAHATGPDGNITISGAMSFENLFLLNGAVIQDNVRNEPLSLFIEDAIQEATVATSGISAEYGRFSGGVVNAVTRSGGNMFSGTYRSTFENDEWRTVSPFEEAKLDKLIPTQMFTVGGPIVRDRLWFFGAGRFVDRKTAEETVITRVPYERSFSEQRYEGKLTLGLPRAHRLQVDYLGVAQEGANSNTATIGFDAMDLRSLVSRKDPQSLMTVNYSGTVGSSLVVEAQYSGRRWTIEDLGGTNSDRIQGTPVFDQSTGASFWAPGFCGVCEEERNNDNVFLKGSYFRSTGAGSHQVIFGYDTFNDRLKGDNRQSASDYWMYGSATNIVGTDIYPVLDEGTFIVHWPLLESSRGTNFRTHAFFVNDTWAANRNLTLNLGLRFDANRGTNASGQLVSDGRVVSPRLGLVWDPAGNGRTTVNASYGRYVAALANSIANSSSSAGLPSILVYQYFGPTFNTDPNAPQVSTPDALAQAFAWFDANRDDLIPVQTTLPGVETQIRGSLKAPHADEFAVGVGHQLGRRASIRLDVVDREFGNFYSERNDTTTGTVMNSIGEEFDLTLVENTNDLTRRYTGLTLLGTYRAGSRVDLGASYTLSQLRGNIDGEDVGSGPRAAGRFRYPEYSDPSWSEPEGDLSADQRHRGRLWGTFMLPASGAADITIGVLQQIESGTPYGAAADIFLFDADGIGYVDNPGYLTPPSTAVYYFSGRDEFRTQMMYRTDLSVGYQRRFGGRPRGIDFFAQFHILNLFNRFQAFNVANGEIDTTILTAVNGDFQPFNPFTETPVQGVHWDYGPRFGEPVSEDAYTLPRTFRTSIGFRF